MSFCAQCGSSSRDKDGFCGGCRAPWPLEAVVPQGKSSGSGQASPLARLSLDPRFLKLTELKPKRVWVAVSLAVMFGPLGLLYCTQVGALVMTVASVLLWFVAGLWSSLIVPVLCALWAWRAARQYPSLLD